MALFDPTSLGPQGRVFDGSNVGITIAGKEGPKNAIKAINPTDAMEGKEHQYALGKKKPFAQSGGIYKPGECTLMVFTSHLDAVLRTVSSAGAYRGVPVDWLITLDEKSSPGLAALATALKLDTKTIALIGFEITGFGTTMETGGGALVTEVKGLPLDIEWFGLPSIAE